MANYTKKMVLYTLANSETDKLMVKELIFYLMVHTFKENLQIIIFQEEFIILKDSLIMESLKIIYLMVKEIRIILTKDINFKVYLNKERKSVEL